MLTDRYPCERVIQIVISVRTGCQNRMCYTFSEKRCCVVKDKVGEKLCIVHEVYQ